MLVEQVAEEVLLVVELVALKARAGPGKKKDSNAHFWNPDCFSFSKISAAFLCHEPIRFY